MTPEQEQKLNKVFEWFEQMQKSSAIPRSTEMALRERLKGIGSTLIVSTKGVDTEDVTVNESGSASYAVMNDPVGFLQVTINNTIYYIPYF